MKRLEFTLPLADNDGRRFTKTQFLEAQREILRVAGGYTVQQVSGEWQDKDGRIYRDVSIRFTVVVEDARVPEMVRLLERFKESFRQKAIWLEVSDVQAMLI